MRTILLASSLLLAPGLAFSSPQCVIPAAAAAPPSDPSKPQAPPVKPAQTSAPVAGASVPMIPADQVNRVPALRRIASHGAQLFDLGIEHGLRGVFARNGSTFQVFYVTADDRPVQADRVRKSVGAERTFERDILHWEAAVPALQPVFAQVWAACTRGGHAGRTVTVKVKCADFQQVTRSRSGADPVATQAQLEQVSLDLLRPLFPPRLGVRLLGATVSGLDAGQQPAPAQLALGLG